MSGNGRPVYVIGTSGLALEMAQLVLEVHEPGAFSGFVAESPDLVGNDLGVGPVASDDAAFLDARLEADVVLGIGYPGARARVIERYLAAGERLRFPTLIHPTAHVDPRHVNLGRGNIVTAGCIFTLGITVGDFTLFNLNTTVGHAAQIGSCCVLNPGVNISGDVVIGDRVLVGTGAQILEGRTIGSDATIGAGAVVNRDVAEGITVVGVPARPIG